MTQWNETKRVKTGEERKTTVTRIKIRGRKTQVQYLI